MSSTCPSMNFCDKQRCLEFCIMDPGGPNTCSSEISLTRATKIHLSLDTSSYVILKLLYSYIGYNTGYSSPTQDAIRKDLNLSLAELCVCFRVCVVAFVVSESGAAGFIIWRNGL
ncbi:hypothetical protein QL285_030055 [Trifolium repens]|nr:hypothetical protein QL285_030055 [Trifolium repens]